MIEIERDPFSPMGYGTLYDPLQYKLPARKKITTARKAHTEQQVRDRFGTPSYATRLLLPFIPKEIKTVWECAYGEGRISRIIREAGYTVIESDLKSDDPNKVGNFLTDESKINFNEMKFAVITNPPFSIKDLFIERCFSLGTPFALLINMDYSHQMCEWIRRGAQKIVPDHRVAFITPFILQRVNDGEGSSYEKIDDIPSDIVYKYTSAQFHSGWLTWGFNLPSSEIIVPLSIDSRKNDIL